MTLKILATADWQLGKAFSSLGQNAKAFRQQLFDTAKDVMKNHAPDYDMVVIAGDLFDSESAPFSLIEEVAQMLAVCKTPTFIIGGNHDSIASGIPKALEDTLANLGAEHVTVMNEQRPYFNESLGITFYPGTVKRRDDLADQWKWIPERTKDDGIRIGLFHAAIKELPNGTLPSDVASQRDLDIAIVGDQHGPSNVEEGIHSMLFDIETSTKRKLFYSGALEAMHIAQPFTGSFLNISMNKTGKITNAERVKVGKIRFFRQDFEFSEDIENSFQQIEDFETMIDEADSGFSSIKMTIHGHLAKEQDDILQDIILNMKEKYPIIEIAEEYSTESQITHDDPIFELISNALNEQNDIDNALKERALILLKSNLRRWQ